MKLVENEEGWHIEGPGKERARLAYASEEKGHLLLTLQPNPAMEYGKKGDSL